MSLTRIAIVASVVWILAVFAYGMGYLARLETGAGTQSLVTLELMFFAFAVVGPVAMLWIVVTLLRRAENLSDNIAAQGESALALAATVANLNDSIDQLSAATQGRLVRASERVEHQSDQAAATFERTLEDMSSRLNRVLLESVVLIDERIAARLENFDAALERQRASLDQHLRDDTVRLTDALEAQSTNMQRRLNEDTARLSAAIETELSSLAEMKMSLMDHVRSGLTESRALLDQGIGKTLSQQQAGVQEANQRLHIALDAFSSTLGDLQSRQSKLIDSDIGGPVRELTAVVENTRAALAAKPPATAEALADLLGKSAQQLLRRDRKVMEDVVLRVEGLEEKAARMLDMIDRTSRLNPLMEVPQTPPKAPFPLLDPGPNAELPFAELPRSVARAPVNWTAATRALDDDTGLNGAHSAVRAAAGDPDLAILLRQTSALAKALAEDKVHLEDLTLEHAPASLWHRYGMGERGPEIAVLGEVSDDITTALVRARLRGDMEFRTLAIRFADAYGRVLSRAAADLGPDPKLVEMAETRTGRAFVLLGGMVGAFNPVSDLGIEPLDRADLAG
ncbi:MAG: hypothetical protein AAGH68_02135 [Pseudomonadota bacterium]